MKFCSGCGQAIEETSKFCPKCGNSVNTNSNPIENIDDRLIFKYGFSRVDLTYLLECYKGQPKHKIINQATKDLKNECHIPTGVAKQVIMKAYYSGKVLEVTEDMVKKHKIRNTAIVFAVVGWAVFIGLVGILNSNKDSSKTTNTSASVSETNKKDDAQTNNSTADKPVETKREEVEKLEPIIEVSCEKLYQDYEDNAIAADEKYRYKIIQTSGVIDDIYREIGGEPYVNLKIDGHWKNVRVTFKKEQETAITKLKKGQTITVKGKCTGKLITSTVSLDNSEIVSK